MKHFFFLLCAVILVACNAREGAVPATAAAVVSTAAEQTAAKEAEAERIVQLADCRENIVAKTAAYRRLMNRKEYWPATLEIRRCSELIGDPKLRALVADGEVKSYVQDIESQKTLTHDRIRSIEALARDYPEKAKRYEKLLSTLNASADQERRDSSFRNRFTRTPRIGSTMQEVITTFWGHPSSVNKTTTVRGTSEQWVYDVGRYLYFDNGILTAIQE